MQTDGGTHLSINWHLVVGAALHWSSMLYMGIGGSGAAPTSLVDAIPNLQTPVVAILALCVAAVPRLMENARPRAVVELIGIATGIAALVLYLTAPGGPYGTVESGIAFGLLLGFNIASLVLLWGFAFASLDKRTAGGNTALTALLSISLAASILALSTTIGTATTAIGLVSRMASACILLSGRVPFRHTERMPNKAAGLAVIRFYVSRAVLGFAIGTFYGAAFDGSPSIALACVSVAMSAIIACVLLRLREPVYGYLPVLPLALIGCLYLPFATTGSQALPTMAASIIWLCWIFTSSFQLSGLKETFGMGEARLSFSEKAVLMTGWTLGLVIRFLIGSVSEPFALATAYIAVLWATYASFRTVYNRQEDAFIARLEQERAEQDNHIYTEICKRYGLTPREREVMEMLVQGHTRPYICKALSIADGTARAHAFHVYQKLGVHKKDELLKLVQQISREMPTE